MRPIDSDAIAFRFGTLAYFMKFDQATLNYIIIMSFRQCFVISFSNFILFLLYVLFYNVI